MNTIREKILNGITGNYKDFALHKDLIAFCVCSEYFLDEESELETDFEELIVVVEKEWLFDYMDMENPLDYLQNEYTSEDSIDWFEEALRQDKVVMVSFN